MATRLKTKWIDDLAITEAKIQTNAVTTNKINGLAVTTAKLDASAVTNAKLAVDAVDATNIVANAVTEAKIATSVAGNGLTGAGGSAMSVQADGTSVSVGVSGVKISDGGVDAGMLAGGIPDSKLNTITTADKVSASAVEDKFLRNDSDDTSTGKISAAGLDAQGNKVTGVADGVDNADAVNVAQLDQVSTESKAWKEAVLHPDQLVSGLSGGLFGAQVFQISANLVSGDTLTLNDGTGTESYVAGTDFAIGGTINDTMGNINTAVNSGAIAVSSVVTDLQSIDSTSNVIVFTQDTVGEPTRIYGNAAVAARANLLPASSLYDGDAGNLVAIPTSDPAVTNFGFFRDRTDLATSETHLTRSANASYTWDNDSTAWNLSGEGSVPLASEAVFGKVKISDGISVIGGVISSKPDSVGGANLAQAIDVNSNGIAVKVDDLTIGEDLGGQLEVVDGGITNAKMDSSAIDTLNLIDSAVTGDKIADNAVSGMKIDSSSISDYHITDDAVKAAAINADVAGDGLTQGIGGELDVNPDDITLETSADVLQVKPLGIDTTHLIDDSVDKTKIAADIAGDGLTQGIGGELNVNPDDVGGANLATVIDVNSNGVALQVATDPGLEDDSTGLKVKVKSAGGIILDSDGLSVDSASINAMSIEEHTISAGDVTSESFTLSLTAANTNEMTLVVYGGVRQNFGSDYTYADTTTVTWSGLGLAGTIEAGDELQVTYPS